jgi:hypothetical protein
MVVGGGEGVGPGSSDSLSKSGRSRVRLETGLDVAPPDAYQVEGIRGRLSPVAGLFRSLRLTMRKPLMLISRLITRRE